MVGIHAYAQMSVVIAELAIDVCTLDTRNAEETDEP